MKIHPINPVNNPVKLQLEIGSSGKITANIKVNREEIGANTEKKSKGTGLWKLFILINLSVVAELIHSLQTVNTQIRGTLEKLSFKMENSK